MPPGIGDDDNCIVIVFHDLTEAGTVGDRGFVVALHFAAENRTVLDRRAQHARQVHVDRIDLAAVELGGRIQPIDRLAGNLPFLRISELDALQIRRLELGGGRGHFAVGR